MLRRSAGYRNQAVYPRGGTAGPVGRRGGAVALCALALAAGATATPAPALAACQGAGARPGQASADRLAAATRCLINQRRQGHDVRNLRGNGKLTRAAVRHSRQMVKYRFFSHTGRGGSTPVSRVRRTGYFNGGSWAVAENIAWGRGRRGKPRAIVRAWMRSSGHRRNILERSFRHVGVGVVNGSPKGGRGATWTVDFGRR